MFRHDVKDRWYKRLHLHAPRYRDKEFFLFSVLFAVGEHRRYVATQEIFVESKIAEPWFFFNLVKLYNLCNYYLCLCL